MSSTAPYRLGIDLGGSSVKGVAVDLENQTLAKFHQTFDPEIQLHFADAVRQVLTDATEQIGSPPILCGLSAPGLAAADAQSIAIMPGRLNGLVNLHWQRFLGQSETVRVLNDAQAALMGEVWLGAARGVTNAFMLTLGTGVGGAAMVDGNLLRGHCGRAGHLGHISLDPTGDPDITGTPGSLEDAIGNHNILSRTDGRFQTTHALIEAVTTGDESACRIWRRSVRALAAGIASLINVLDPEVVILGGGVSRAGETLLEPLRRDLELMEWRPSGTGARIVLAQLGDLAGAYGAIAPLR